MSNRDKRFLNTLSRVGLHRVGVPALLCALLGTLPTQASAQVQCGDRAAIMSNLAIKYDEHLTYQGVMVGGEVTVDLFVQSESGNWTLLYSYPNDVACLVAHGTDWGKVMRSEASKGRPS